MPDWDAIHVAERDFRQNLRQEIKAAFSSEVPIVVDGDADTSHMALGTNKRVALPELSDEERDDLPSEALAERYTIDESSEWLE